MGYAVPFDWLMQLDPLVQGVFWLGVGALVLTLVAMVCLILQRVVSLHREHNTRQFLAEWRPLISRALAGDDSLVLPKLPAVYLLDFLQLWLHYQESLRGESRHLLNQIFAQQALRRRLHRLLKRGNLRQRLLAATTVGHLQDEEMWDVLVGLMHKHSPIAIVAARSLVQIDAQRAAPLVIPQILAHRDWSQARLSNLLSNEGSALVPPLLEAIGLAAWQKLPQLGRLMRLLEPIGFHPDNQFLAPILIGHEDPGTLVSALRLFRSPQDIHLVYLHMQHPDWHVRAEVASTLGRLGSADDLPRLEQLLQAQEWGVRRQAARALVAAPFVQPGTLDTLILQHQGEHAAAALQQAIADLEFK